MFNMHHSHRNQVLKQGKPEHCSTSHGVAESLQGAACSRGAAYGSGSPLRTSLGTARAHWPAIATAIGIVFLAAAQTFSQTASPTPALLPAAPVLLLNHSRTDAENLQVSSNALYATPRAGSPIRIEVVKDDLVRLHTDAGCVSVNADGLVRLRPGKTDASELLQWLPEGSDGVRLLSKVNGKLLRVDAHDSALWADSNKQDQETLFTWKTLPSGQQTAPSIQVQLKNESRPISPHLFGIFFEDLSWAADGGLYAELVQNRSFEYSAADRENWSGLSNWTVEKSTGAQATVSIAVDEPLNANNPNYAVLQVEQAGAGVALVNEGFDGMALTAGQRYHLSLFARVLAGQPGSIGAKLIDEDGTVLAQAEVAATSTAWTKLSTTLESSKTTAHARLALTLQHAASLALDVVSLMPENTFHHHANGLRPDLAESIAALKPAFMRFPGGCLTHGNGLVNIYNWKDSIGPLEQRREQPNLWHYHQSLGLGYFEFFQFAEDLSAEPLPVLAAGISCQNSGAGANGFWEKGQQALPLPEMPGYIQDVLDLLEYANGPATSVWGAKRAAAGHPEPFHLHYVGIGNEDEQSEAFRTRFQMIYAAVHKAHPEITVVGTVGAYDAGKDYDDGWRFARAQHLPMVDEHYYQSPEWFLEHLHRYDNYKRDEAHVYLGEYSAAVKHITNWRSALAEAAYMTQLERNGDVVEMSSYAPLLARAGHGSWEPNLIHFSNTAINTGASYEVQRLFGANPGDAYFDAANTDQTVALDAAHVALSATRAKSGAALVLKLVNYGETLQPLELRLPAPFRAGHIARENRLQGELGQDYAMELNTTETDEELKLTPQGLLQIKIAPHTVMVLRIER